MYLEYFIANNAALAAVLALMLAVWVYTNRRHDVRNISFGTMLATVSAWTLSLLMWNRAITSAESAFWLRSIFFIGTLIPFLFLWFSVSFKNMGLSAWQTALLGLPPIIATAVFVYLSRGLIYVADYGAVVDGRGRAVLAVVFGLTLTAALLVLARNDKTNSAGRRYPIILILIGAIISFNSVFGVLFGTDLQAESTGLFIANACLMVGMFIMASIVVERDFLARLRLLGPQLFFLATLFIIVLQTLITQSDLELSLRATIVGVLVAYIVIMTRTMVQAVRHTGQIEIMNEQAMQMNRELMEADRMKTRFVSLASHQLRAPINGVRMYTEMLLGGDFGALNAKQQDIMDKNVKALARLSETVDIFLNAARIQLGKLDIIRTETDLVEIIGQVTNALGPVAAAKKLVLESKVPKRLPPVSCDGGKIYHVVMNLVDNAVKYTKEGRVTVQTRLDGPNLEVIVKDTGIGLDDEEKATICDVFKRGIEAVRLDTTGAGLGLFIVKSILDAHGSEIKVESAGRGQGSNFSFRLPTA